MSLKTRILGLTAAIVLLASAASWFSYQALSNQIIERWGQQVTEIQVRYDSARLLSALEREIGLARQMAESQTLVRWAEAPSDGLLEAAAIQEMESFRSNFGDNSYFVALLANRHYYYNNENNDYGGDQFRYVLDANDPDDAWFFQLVEEGRDFHLNVNPDTELGVTKLWIDVLVRNSADEIVAMVGTGLNLESFLQDIVDIGQEGITTLFVDYNGAIQLYRDQNYIDFASIIKPEGQKNTVDLLFEQPEDQASVLAMLDRLRTAPPSERRVESRFVTVDGSRHLAGAAFLPTIGWFEITLLDLDTLVPEQTLWPLVGVSLATLAVALIALYLAVQWLVIRPVTGLERAAQEIREGRYDIGQLPKPSNEIGHLADHFERMAADVRRHTEELESQVAERTERLHRQARIDSLTGLLNRRGLDEELHLATDRAKTANRSFGVLWLDIDHFKQVNDAHGHQDGDQVLEDVSRLLQTCVRSGDRVGRWGGDEFVIVLGTCTLATLQASGERIRSAIESGTDSSRVAVSVSIGGYLAQPGDDVDTVLRHADWSLYQAKQSGRNRVIINAIPPRQEG